MLKGSIIKFGLVNHSFNIYLNSCLEYVAHNFEQPADGYPSIQIDTQL